jgi:hypothetical protein
MIQNTIENAIRAAYAAGKTQMQIAHMIGASDAYLKSVGVTLIAGSTPASGTITKYIDNQ